MGLGSVIARSLPDLWKEVLPLYQPFVFVLSVNWRSDSVSKLKFNHSGSSRLRKHDAQNRRVEVDFYEAARGAVAQ